MPQPDPLTDALPAIPNAGITVALQPFETLPITEPGFASAVNPQFIVPAPNNPASLFIGDQSGILYETATTPGSPLAPFLDLRGQFGFDPYLTQESGLVGLAFDPNFAGDPARPGYATFYVNYAADPGSSPADFGTTGKINHLQTVRAFTVADPHAATLTLSPAPSRIVLALAKSIASHGGGALGFDPNAQPGGADYGKLYIGTGDDGQINDPAGNAQNPQSPFGKILRIDPSVQPNGAEYGIPVDNPFTTGTGAAPLVWALGLRNPQQFSWEQGGQGRMFIADIGQDRIEEVDLGAKAANYGWNILQGRFANGPIINGDINNVDIYAVPSSLSTAQYTAPIAEYSHDEFAFAPNETTTPYHAVAIGGGFLYHGAGIPELDGKYVFSDFVQGRLFFIDPATATPTQDAPTQSIGLNFNGVIYQNLDQSALAYQGYNGARTDMRLGVDGAGELYAMFKGSGDVFRLVDAAGSGPRDTYVSASQSFSGLQVGFGAATFVAPGGSVSATAVTRGGTLVVYGGTATGTTLTSGGNEFLQAGGDSLPTIGAGAMLTVSGGIQTSAAIAGQEAVFGGTVLAATVQAGGQAYAVGGSILSATVCSSGLLTISGGTASGATVLAGGNLFVLAGTDAAATLSSGATLTVSGGTDSGSTVLSGGTADAVGRGVLLGATVSAGGTLELQSGGAASGTLLLSGGRIDLATLTFRPGGETFFNSATGGLLVTEGRQTAALILGSSFAGERFALAADDAGGTVVTAIAQDTYVSAGEVLSGREIEAGEAAFIASGGTINDATVASGGTLVVYGGTAFAITVGSGGSEFLQSGTDLGATVAGTGTITVSGGSQSGAAIGGQEAVFGGTVSGAAVSGGGQIYIAGGSVTDAAIGSLGLLTVSGGAASACTVLSGGNLFVLAGSDTAATVRAGGVLTVSGGIDTGSVLGSGGVAFVTCSGLVTGTTVSSGGLLLLQGGAQSATMLLNGGAIDLHSLAFSTTSGFDFNSATDTITLAAGGVAQTICLTGNYANTAFQYTADTGGGTLITAAARV